MTNDEYLQSQIAPMLQPGEQVLQSAYMRRQPGLVMQMLLVGGLLLFLITKAYFVVLTNRRLILIRTKMTFFGGPAQLNLEIEQHDVRNLKGCTTSGLANNRSMTFELHQPPGFTTLRISPWQKQIAGTAQFFEQVPQMIGSGQLAQLAAGAPPLQQLQLQQPPQQQPQPQMHQQPPQQPQMQQPQMQQPQMQQPQMQQPQMAPQGFAPGQPVVVTYPDGNRYSATVAQVASGQYLCTMPDGQSYWFPVQAVGAA